MMSDSVTTPSDMKVEVRGDRHPVVASHNDAHCWMPEILLSSTEPGAADPQPSLVFTHKIFVDVGERCESFFEEFLLFKQKLYRNVFQATWSEELFIIIFYSNTEQRKW